ncbi:Pyrazinamidase / Nicotinamidase, partial [Giardia duodenalis]
VPISDRWQSATGRDLAIAQRHSLPVICYNS